MLSVNWIQKDVVYCLSVLVFVCDVLLHGDEKLIIYSLVEEEKCSSVIMDQNAAILDRWDKLRDWIYCICVVTFDLELGQAMEVILLFSEIN